MAEEEKIQMGGQAVIEGVMMRSPLGYSIAVRKKDKSIKVKCVPYKALAKRVKILGLPFIRGFIMLFEMLIIGLKGLDFSVNEWEGDYGKEAGDHPDSKEKAIEDANAESPENKKNDDPKEERQLSIFAMAGMMLFSIGLGLALFVVVPNFLTHFLGKILPLGASSEGGLEETRSPFFYNLISGFFRALILVTYIWVISLSKNIHRVFEYHGAEHKAVFAFEDKKSLTVENVRPYITRHPRCGTTFIGVVIIISIFAFALIVKNLGILYPPFLEMSFLKRKAIIIFLHILFMPVIAGISYEIIKFGSRHLDNPLTRILTYPGILSQYLTTKEPDDEQLEVSIASLKAALSINQDLKEPKIAILHPNETPQ
ncbi:DUF1385 domain-containing protein [Candidatus Sumerlaeota bacterium]|nr:DUF1385 domain-containing protein [Candidatus Sumerlaeota bacterium]